MRSKDWHVSIFTGVILGILIIISQQLGYFPQTQSVSAASNTDKVLSEILKSHVKWSSLQGEAQITQYDLDGTPHTDVIDVEISQPFKANVGFQKSDDKEKIDTRWVSDGELIYQVNDKNLSYAESNIPSFAKKQDFIPRTLAEVKKDEVYHHPFEMLISNPIMEYVYPAWFAQARSGSIYQLLGEENIAGRLTWKVDLKTETDHVIAWVDQDTGVILKYSQETLSGQSIVEMEFIRIDFDKQIDVQKFVRPDKQKYQKVDNK